MGVLRPLVSASCAVLALSLVAAPAPAVEEPTTPEPAVPVPVVPDGLPEDLDKAAFYEAQTRCDSVARPGTNALKDLLLATYGPATAYITRACTSSTSEHFDGRALDWMRNKRVPAEKEMVNTFLDWLLAPAADGTPHEMARRMGIMYIIWNGRMTRMYDPGRGWTEYRSCRSAGNTGPALDTSCHRNHVHFSMSWDGAAKKTSWWSGRAQTQPLCSQAYTSADPGSGRPAAASDLTAIGGLQRVRSYKILDTRSGSGAGLSGPCRALAGRSLYPNVFAGADRVPGDAHSVVVRVYVRGNAPAELSAWSSGAPRPAGQVATPMGTTGTTLVVPVASDGTLGLGTSLGAASLTAWVVGYVPQPSASVEAEPDVVSIPTPPRSVRTMVRRHAVRTVWEAPASDGGAPILGYRVQALKHKGPGAPVVGTCYEKPNKATLACKIFGIPRREKRYWMSVSVHNDVGWTWAPRVPVKWN